MPAPGCSGSPQACSGFLPSRDGFAFANDWPPAPGISLLTPVGKIGIGNAAAGLCGGMVFAALDYWHARLTPPVQRPEPGSPLYRFLVRRLIKSWHIPGGVARYYGWMNLPDGDSHLDLLGRRLLSERGISSRTVAAQWPRLRASLDRGTPAALGLVAVASTNPARLRHNHQALAFGYTIAGSEVTVRVYDPNSGPDDGVGIRFDTSSPVPARPLRHNLKLDWPVRGFFVTQYSPVVPPSPERT
jgi:hypothetical protein